MSEIPKYIGRSIDVLAFRGGQKAGEVLLEQSLADQFSTGEICTGLQKLAQRFLLVFLTERGSVKYFPDYGTDFMIALRQGRVHNEADMLATFALAEQDAAAQLVDEELATDPADERYRTAELSALTVVPGFANLTIELRSQAEDGVAEFILPIPIVV